jgi:hypothetical protein
MLPSFFPRTQTTVSKGEAKGATNEDKIVRNFSLSFIAIISFDVEISFLFLCFIYFFFIFSSPFFLTAIQSCYPFHRVLNLPMSIGKVGAALAV